MLPAFLPPRVAALSLIGFTVLLGWLAGPDGTRAGAASDDQAEAALKRLSERVSMSGTDPDKLRPDILAFRRTYPGTAAAAKAAGLLTQLPSALDKLDPKTIPALDRFDWQPKELVAVLGEHRGRHGTTVSCVAFSPDGKTVASGGGSLVRLWDPATMRQRALVGYGGSTTCLAFTKDSKTLAAGGTGGSVYIWDLAADAPTLRFTIPAATNHVYAVAFSPNGKTVAVGCYDNFARLYDISGKAPKEQATIGGHEKAVSSLAYHPDGKTLATGSYDMTVRLWDVTGEPQEKAVLTGHTKDVLALAFNTTGGTLASAGSEGSVLLWSFPATSKSKPRAVLPVAAGVNYSVHFSPSGRTLAVGCGDYSVRLWNVSAAQPKEQAKLEGHINTVTGAGFSPDGRMLVSGSTDWTVRTWEVGGPKPVQRFQPWSHLSHIYSVAFTPDCQTLASGSEDRILRLWDLTRAEPRTRNFLKGDSVAIYAVAFSADGQRLAVGGNHTTVRQYEATTGKGQRPLAGHPGGVSLLAYSPDGRQLLTASRETILLWDTISGKELRRMNGHETPVNCLAYAADGRYALSGSGTYLYKDGKIVYMNNLPVYTDCLLRQWDVDKGREVTCIKSHTVPVYSAAFTPDSRRAYTGAYEAVLKIWDVGDDGLAEKDGIHGTSGYVHATTFAPDGQTMLTRGLDGKMILWDVATAKRLREWVFHETIGAAVFSSDGRHLAVSLGTGVVYILRLAPPPARTR